MSSLSCIAYAGSSIATSRCQLPTCQTHRKTEFRLWLCGCANPSRDLAVTHSLSPSLITELSLDSSISDIAYSPHIRANALPSSTGALSTCSNSSDVINLLVYNNVRYKFFGKLGSILTAEKWRLCYEMNGGTARAWKEPTNDNAYKAHMTSEMLISMQNSETGGSYWSYF